MYNARASKVSVHCADFLKLNPDDHQDVKYILVDPSCSGTGKINQRSVHLCRKIKRTYLTYVGIVNRLDPKRKPEDEALQLRLKKLSSLQSRLVEHAATFPHVERIVIFMVLLN